MHIRIRVALTGVLLAFGSMAAQSESVLIVNARIIDGTGAPTTTGAVRIEGSRIVAVGALSPRPGEAVVEAGGNVLAPGFIDSHSHHDDGIFEHREVVEAISQGITTIVAGQDGGSILPLAKFFRRFERRPANVNVASYVGHAPVRFAVMGDDYKRAATAKELAKMQRLLAREMSAGALGLSSGLEYEPGSYSAPEEVMTLAREAARHGGRYISHMRSEDVALDAAIDELVGIGREACMPVQISHFKIAVRTRWGDSRVLLQRLDAARAEGIDVTADAYPYDFWQSTLTVLFPDQDYQNRDSARMALETIATPEDLILSAFEADPRLVGRSLAQVAQQRGSDAVTTLIALIRESQAFGKQGGEESVMGKSMNETDIAAFITWPHTNISSDGSMLDAHPRGAGSFTRVLRKYVREDKALTLEQAIHKMTGLTAGHLGIADRGVIRAGLAADLVLLDPATVTDRATIEQPTRLSTGIHRVWVNGMTVWQDGAATRAYAGQVVRRSSEAEPFACKQ